MPKGHAEKPTKETAAREFKVECYMQGLLGYYSTFTLS